MNKKMVNKKSLLTFDFNFIRKILFVFFLLAFYLFGENLNAQCSTSVVPPDTINGVIITESYTGSVTTNYASSNSSCADSNTATTPAYSLWLGAGGSFSYTMKFNKAINDLVIVITATGGLQNENFIFTTSQGNPTITTSSSCYSTISGNELLSGAGAPTGLGGGGGGIFTISTLVDFTSLTISGSGGDNGSLLAVCSSSVVKVKFPSFNTQYVSICKNKSLNVGKRNYTSAGIYKDTFMNYRGFDSILTTYLSIKPITSSVRNVSICPGKTFSTSKYTYTSAGVYTDTVMNYLGCDSFITFNLTVNPVTTFSQNIAICAGGKYQIGSNTYYSAGTYTDKFINQSGCDSIVTTKIIVKTTSSFSQTLAICDGLKYTIGRNSYSKAGLYTDTILNYQGCDSFVTTSLMFKPSPVSDFSFKKNTITTNDTLVLTNLSIGADKYLWNFGNYRSDTSMLANPVFIYSDDGNKHIMLIAINSLNGCSDTMIRDIEIIDNSAIFIPVVFTPNEDGLNDFFFPISLNYNGINMRIFNRWGELIYETREFSPGWDGKYKGEYCQQDIYMYVIEFTNTYPYKKKRFSGTLTVLK